MFNFGFKLGNFSFGSDRRKFLGIDIGGTVLKIIELENKEGKLYLSNYAWMEIPKIYSRSEKKTETLFEIVYPEYIKKALKEYITRWNGKHPLPYDFFNTFNEVTQENLSWYWQPWFFEKGYPDLAIKKIENGDGVVRVLIEKVGNIPVPIHLTIQTGEGSEISVDRSAAIWKDGAKEVWIEHELIAPPKQITLGSKYIPDVNRTNN